MKYVDIESEIIYCVRNNRQDRLTLIKSGLLNKQAELGTSISTFLEEHTKDLDKDREIIREYNAMCDDFSFVGRLIRIADGYRVC